MNVTISKQVVTAVINNDYSALSSADIESAEYYFGDKQLVLSPDDEVDGHDEYFCECDVTKLFSDCYIVELIDI